jgi:sporulation protein YlmC with PRC-barrel domain
MPLVSVLRSDDHPAGDETLRRNMNDDATAPVDDWPRFNGHQVLAEDGQVVGTITDVVYDDMTERPVWGVVNPGTLRSRHYVPLVPPTYISEAGAVVVPYDKSQVLHAPKVHRDHVVTPMLRRELEHHYSLAE